MTTEQKEWIDKATYEELLRLWRNAPAGNLMFQGDTGQYHSKAIAERREAKPGEHVAASKSIGWDGP